MQRKHKRRLILLGSIVGLLGLAAGTVTLYRMHRIEQHFQGLREQGLANLAAGEPRQAMYQLAGFVGRYPDDGEALYALAQARLQVDEAGATELVSGAALMRRVVDVVPDHPTARDELLELYRQLGYDTETLDLAERLLQGNPLHEAALMAKLDALTSLKRPADALKFAASLEKAVDGDTADPRWPAALYGKARALAAQEQWEEAFAAADAYNQLRPADDDAQIFTLQLLGRLGRVEPMLERAMQLRDAHPQDLRFATVYAAALRSAGRLEEARAAAAVAVDRPFDDERTAMALVRELDALRMDELAVTALERGWSATGSVTLQIAFAARQLQAGNPEAALAAAQAPVRTGGRHVRLQALEGWALHTLGRTEAFDALTADLAGQTGDSAAPAWATLLRYVHAPEPSETRRALVAAEQLLAGNRADALLQYAVGVLRRSMNEADQAITAFSAAASLAPWWIQPRVDLATLLVSAGRPLQALPVLQSVLRQQPNLAAAHVLALQAAGAAGERFSPPARNQLLDETRPLLDSPIASAIVPAYVSLLIQAERHAEADALLADVAADRFALTDAQRAGLARLALAIDASSTDALLARLAAAPAESPDAAYARAMLMLQRGVAADGLALIDAGLAAAPQQDRGDWLLARTVFLDQYDAADAVGHWNNLLDDQPESLHLASKAMYSRASALDRPLLARAVDRVAQLSPAEGVEQRLGQARLLLIHPQADSDVSRAADLLFDVLSLAPTRVDVRVMLSRALRRLGNLPSAAEQLQAAAQLSTDPAPLLLEAAELLAEAGRANLARGVVTDVLAMPTVGPAEWRTSAGILARIGDDDHAARLLERVAIDQRRTEDELLLAQLHARQGRSAEADAAYRRLMADPAPGTIERYASFLLGQGRTRDAEAVLARLDGLSVEPALREMILAGFELRRGNAGAAHVHLSAAVAADASVAQAWRQLIVLCLENGMLDRAVTTLHDAAKAVDEPRIDALAGRPDLLGTLQAEPGATTLVARVLVGTSELEPALEAMQLLAAAREDELLRVRQVMQVVSLANRHPRDYALQMLAARQLQGVGELDTAARQARRVMDQFADAVEPAEFATQMLQMTGRHAEALETARQWRRRAGDHPVAADLAVARLEAQLGRGNAVETLEPYLRDALADPDRHVGLILSAARSKLTAGKSGAVAAMLRPLLDRSPAWQDRWLGLATALDSRDEAVAWIEQLRTTHPPVDDARALSFIRAWSGVFQRFGDARDQATAAQLLDPLLGRNDELGRQAVLLQATAAQVARRSHEAEAAYRRLLELDPDSAVALNNLAMLLIDDHRDLEQARDFAARAAAMLPNSAETHDTLGLAELRLGRPSEAVRAFRRAIRLKPGDLAMQLNLAEGLLAGSERDEARQVLDRVAAALQHVPATAELLRDRVAELRRRLSGESAARPDGAPLQSVSLADIRAR